MVNELQEDNCSSISVQNNSLQASRTSYRTPEYRGSIPKKTRLKKKKSYQLRAFFYFLKDINLELDTYSSNLRDKSFLVDPLYVYYS